MSIVFSPALMQPTRPEYADDFEAPLCTSLYWLPPDPARRGSQSLRCPLDADHERDQFDDRHGRGDTRWTDEQARQNLADFGPRPAAGPLCTDCGIRPAAGLCGVCFAAVERDENREVIEA